MSREFSRAQALAYVDGSLGTREREEFEVVLGEAPEARRLVAAWEAQNRAVRAAFAENGPRLSGIALRTTANENRPHEKAHAIVEQSPRPHDGSAPDAKVRRRPALRSIFARPISALAFFLLSTNVPDGIRADVIGATAQTAYLVYAASTDTVRDPRAPKPTSSAFGVPVAAPRLDAGRWTVIGARPAPGMRAPSLVLTYESVKRERFTLTIEPSAEGFALMSASVEAASRNVKVWAGTGQILAAVGPANSEDFVAFVAAVRSALPAN